MALIFKKPSICVGRSRHQGQTLEIVPSQPIPLGKAEIDELDRDAYRRAGTDKGWIRCPSLIMAAHELGFVSSTCGHDNWRSFRRECDRLSRG